MEIIYSNSKYDYCKFDDSIRELIEDKMIEYDSTVYTEDDFDNYFSSEHINVVALHDGYIVSFACLVKFDNGYKMCYTYTEKHHAKAYARGIDVIVSNFSPIYFGSGALKFNKIKRMLNVSK